MHFEQVRRGELVAACCGFVLAISVFLNWYSTDFHNTNSRINGQAMVKVSAWNSLSVLRWLFLLAAVAPLILLWIVVREHQLSWPRGELTAIVAIVAFVLCLVAGFVAKPGDPTDSISLQYGWYLAIVATLGMLAGAVQRTKETARVRKPPGVL
jgi:hypothetical protein